MEARDETSKDKGKKQLSQASQAMPYVNWMEKGMLNEVRDQGHCDCCWAIVACAAIESLFNIKNKPRELFQLAPQELVNCVKKEKESCYTCSINEGFRYAKQYGIRREIDCPFKAQKQPCLNKDKDMPALIIGSFKKIDYEDEDGIIEVLKEQPIGAAILITDEFENYEGGIYEEPDEIYAGGEGPALHAVLLMGCGTDEDTGKNFWLIQNSWGTSWGSPSMNGYAKIMRNSSRPHGRRPILSRLSYPKNVKQFLCPREQKIDYCSTRK